MDVAAGAREGWLPLGQVLKSCKCREVGDPPRCKKYDAVAAISIEKSRSQEQGSYLQAKS